MLKSLHVQNYRCLRDVNVDLEPLTVLIGKNDTGKSSFLSAMQKVGDLALRGGADFTNANAADMVWRGATSREMSWQCSVALGRGSDSVAASYSVTTRADEAGRNLSAVEELAIVDPLSEVRRPRNEASVSMRDVTQLTTAGVGMFGLATVAQNPDFAHLGQLARSLQAAGPYRLDPEVLARPGPIRAEAGLGSHGEGLVAVLDGMLGLSRKAFEALELAFATAMPFVSSIRLKPVALADGRDGKEIWFGLRNGEIPARLASDGALVYLAYLALVYGTGSAPTLLIEEPENGIHPRKLPEVIQLLKSLTDEKRGEHRKQVVIATHSPYLLDHVPPECVRVFGRASDGSTIVRKITDLFGVDEHIAKGWSLGELWFNLGEDKLLGGLP